MVGNNHQKLLLIRGDGSYTSYNDNNDLADYLSKGWRITQISGFSRNSYEYCYVIIEKENDNLTA